MVFLPAAFQVLRKVRGETCVIKEMTRVPDSVPRNSNLAIEYTPSGHVTTREACGPLFAHVRTPTAHD